jgi:hypothetical protein
MTDNFDDYKEIDMNKKFELNAGTGMVAGVFVAALVALVVSMITGDDAVWTWAIPVGIAVGLAIGAGRQSKEV